MADDPCEARAISRVIDVDGIPGLSGCWLYIAKCLSRVRTRTYVCWVGKKAGESVTWKEKESKKEKSQGKERERERDQGETGERIRTRGRAETSTLSLCMRLRLHIRTSLYRVSHVTCPLGVKLQIYVHCSILCKHLSFL